MSKIFYIYKNVFLSIKVHVTMKSQSVSAINGYIYIIQRPLPFFGFHITRHQSKKSIHHAQNSYWASSSLYSRGCSRLFFYFATGSVSRSLVRSCSSTSPHTLELIKGISRGYHCGFKDGNYCFRDNLESPFIVRCVGGRGVLGNCKIFLHFPGYIFADDDHERIGNDKFGAKGSTRNENPCKLVRPRAVSDFLLKTIYG